MLKRIFLREENMMIAIFLNAIIIYLMYFPQLQRQPVLEWLDNFFILLFLLEAIVKLVVYKPKGYFGNPWNSFDFVVVVASLPTLLAYFTTIPNTSILLLLRLVRLVRLIRFLRFVPHIVSIMAGLGRAVKASVFVLLALFFLNFLLAVFACHFYSAIAPEYFGNPLLSSYTMFQLFTIEGWNEIPEVLTHRMDNSLFIGFTRIYFVIVVLLGGIFGMSLANAIFVDEMTMDNNKLLENKIDDLNDQLRELKDTLQRMEQNQNPNS
jgi:voltage-gated sodium channel